MPNTTTMLIIGAIAALLLFGKDAPVKALFAHLATLAQRLGTSTANVTHTEPKANDTASAVVKTEQQLPAWITEPNDLQLMLLHLGHHAMRHGNEALKDQTFKLMKSFADLQVKTPESGQ